MDDVDADNVGAGSDASAAPPSVPRMDLSDLVDADAPRASATQIAMKSALEGEIADAGSSSSASASSSASSSAASIETSTTEMLPRRPEDEEVQGPSTPSSPAPATVDTCSICTGNLGENGGTLSLLCGKEREEDGCLFRKCKSQRNCAPRALTS